MNRQTRKRDRQAKTIRPGIDTTTWGTIKRFCPAIAIGALLWIVGLYAVIWIINYRMGG